MPQTTTTLLPGHNNDREQLRKAAESRAHGGGMFLRPFTELAETDGGDIAAIEHHADSQQGRLNTESGAHVVIGHGSMVRAMLQNPKTLAAFINQHRAHLKRGGFNVLHVMACNIDPDTANKLAELTGTVVIAKNAPVDSRESARGAGWEHYPT